MGGSSGTYCVTSLYREGRFIVRGAGDKLEKAVGK